MKTKIYLIALVVFVLSSCDNGIEVSNAIKTETTFQNEPRNTYLQSAEQELANFESRFDTAISKSNSIDELDSKLSNIQLEEC